ncbi:MAG: ORF6N domain-containing protein [Prevotellaceae bacterium]|jgi:hypothetical protein|nr:ORF6N domain-containing protein [Prevotellaceae bacterium]
MNETEKYNQIEKKFLTIGSRQVILDSDVAELYGVDIMHINEAIINNPDKFPKGYIFELSKNEKNEVIKIFNNPQIKFATSAPKAFTEKGLYMLAIILKSDKALQTTIAIVETFVKVRELARSVSKLYEISEEF